MIFTAIIYSSEDIIYEKDRAQLQAEERHTTQKRDTPHRGGTHHTKEDTPHRGETHRTVLVQGGKGGDCR